MVVSMSEVQISWPSVVTTNAANFRAETIYDGTGRSCLIDFSKKYISNGVWFNLWRDDLTNFA